MPKLYLCNSVSRMLHHMHYMFIKIIQKKPNIKHMGKWCNSDLYCNDVIYNLQEWEIEFIWIFVVLKSVTYHLYNVFWRNNGGWRAWFCTGSAPGDCAHCKKEAGSTLTSCNETLIHVRQSAYTEEKRWGEASWEKCRKISLFFNINQWEATVGSCRPNGFWNLLPDTGSFRCVACEWSTL